MKCGFKWHCPGPIQPVDTFVSQELLQIPSHLHCWYLASDMSHRPLQNKLVSMVALAGSQCSGAKTKCHLDLAQQPLPAFTRTYCHIVVPELVLQVSYIQV